MKIGFLGAGRMGSAIAARLIDARHEVALYNRTASKLEALVKRGARVANSPREAAEGADALVSMLADDDALTHAVVEGEHAAMLGLGRGCAHVSMSTISPDLAERLTGLHAARGQVYIAAPVLGRPEAAERGELVVLAAGPAAALARCAPIFEAAGRQTQTIGQEPRAANVVKLAVNFMLASTIETLGEVYALAERYGVPSARMSEILDGSMLRSPAVGAYGEKIAKEDFDPAGFRLALGLKDIGLALHAAEAQAVAMPIASVLRDRFLQAMDLGLEDKDWSAVARAGRSPRPRRPAP
jgi:3-hydroxyisobutyrate dehydrogenase-like beta-hydroxyacid dehydrogenase